MGQKHVENVANCIFLLAADSEYPGEPQRRMTFTYFHPCVHRKLCQCFSTGSFGIWPVRAQVHSMWVDWVVPGQLSPWERLILDEWSSGPFAIGSLKQIRMNLACSWPLVPGTRVDIWSTCNLLRLLSWSRIIFWMIFLIHLAYFGFLAGWPSTAYQSPLASMARPLQAQDSTHECGDPKKKERIACPKWPADWVNDQNNKDGSKSLTKEIVGISQWTPKTWKGKEKATASTGRFWFSWFCQKKAVV